MEGNKAGVGVVIIIAIVVTLSFAYVLTTPSGTHKESIPSNPQYTNTTLLWADAAGWNLNHGTVNPTLNYTVGTLVHFSVTEEDTAPHTLTIHQGGDPSNPQSGEIKSGAFTVLSQAQITQTKGHVSNGEFYFGTAGIYTYWCTVHPTTMIGIIYVNSTTSSSVATMPGVPGLSHSNPIAPQSSLYLPSNINANLQYTSYLDMTKIPGTSGGNIEL